MDAIPLHNGVMIGPGFLQVRREFVDGSSRAGAGD